MSYFTAGPIWRPENGRSFGLRSWVGGAFKTVPRGRRSGVPAFSLTSSSAIFSRHANLDKPHLMRCRHWHSIRNCGPSFGPVIWDKQAVTEKCGQFCGRKMAALLGSVSGSLLFRREDGDVRRPRLWSPSSLALFMRVV